MSSFFSIVGAVMAYVRRRRLDALRRRTADNGMWKYSECPAFLDPERRRPPEPGSTGGYPFDGAIKVLFADGCLWTFPDGRVINCRARNDDNVILGSNPAPPALRVSEAAPRVGTSVTLSAAAPSGFSLPPHA